MVRRKPGASPLLFGEFLMQLCAFVFLEHISGELPPSGESYLSVPMDPLMMAAYRELEDAIRQALKEHKGEPVRSEHRAKHVAALSRPSLCLGSPLWQGVRPGTKAQCFIIIAETRDFPKTGCTRRNGD
jgi:hypothetical protein